MAQFSRGIDIILNVFDLNSQSHFQISILMKHYIRFLRPYMYTYSSSLFMYIMFIVYIICCFMLSRTIYEIRCCTKYVILVK